MAPATTPKIKAEDDASDGGGPANPTFDEDDLQELYAKHAVKDRYPPGCEVWHGLATAGSKRMEARRGVVQGVYVDLGSGGRVYKIARGSGGDEGEKSSVFVAQDQITYAMGCPVNVKGIDESDPDQEWEGNIVCPRPGRAGRTLAYSVQFLREGGEGVRVELGVDAGRISFRRAEEGECLEGAAEKGARDGVQGASSSGGAVEGTQMNVDKQQEAAGAGAKSASASSDANVERPKPNDRPSPPVEEPMGNDEPIPSISEESRGAMPTSEEKKEEARWKPPSSVAQERMPRFQGSKKPDNSGVYCRLTVPIWATTIVPSVHKTREIENETSCNIDISLVAKNPTRITITPMWDRPRFDMIKARERMEDSLLECVQGDGAKARLRYEMALSHDGTSHLQPPEGRMVQQRCHSTNTVVWMNLFDLPAHKEGSLRFQENLQRRVHRMTECSVEVFSHGLLKPFALVCGKNKDSVAKASKAVVDAIEEQQRQTQHTSHVAASLSTALVSARKRASQADFSSLSSHSQDCDPAERPQKMPRIDKPESTEECREATCILTVPLWVMQRCTHDQDLFVHLIGPGGRKTKEISSKANCSINVSHYNSQSEKPMVITIKSNADTPSFAEVRKAKRFVAKSLLEFLGDASSERRLVYELAVTAKGTYNFRLCDGVVKPECHVTHRLVQMKLLELPSAVSKGVMIPHGRYLLAEQTQQELVGNTNCWMEVYSYKDDIPELSGPYVIVCGDNSREVNEVAGRVADAIDDHMRGCSLRCRFFET